MPTVPYKLCYVPWTHWPQVFARSLPYRQYNDENTGHSMPHWFTITPDHKMQVYPVPDKKYVLHFYSSAAIQELEEEMDTPFLPEHTHMMIVWKALMEYGMYNDDRSVFERARSKYRVYKKNLEDRYMPDVVIRSDNLYREL